MAVQDRAGSMVVDHHARGARLARQRLADELAGLVPSALLADTVAIAAELLGNAVRHAAPLPGGVIRLSWLVGPAVSVGGVYVLLKVTDGGSAQAPAPRRAEPDAVDGRGLTIVDALAHRWGVEPAPDGQCVWAELGTPAR
ncbi:MAG TPA: ATP-binding protein [Micromonosporaceae bacterium]